MNVVAGKKKHGIIRRGGLNYRHSVFIRYCVILFVWLNWCLGFIHMSLLRIRSVDDDGGINPLYTEGMQNPCCDVGRTRGNSLVVKKLIQK